jgi:hypothetical protein
MIEADLRGSGIRGVIPLWLYVRRVRASAVNTRRISV